MGFMTPDHTREQGVPWVESGAYVSVRKHFNQRDNAPAGCRIGSGNRFYIRITESGSMVAVLQDGTMVATV
jgi:hypothetical protein